MSGIEREIYLETRTSLIDKHLPNTKKSQTELQTEGIVYLFNVARQWRELHPKSKKEENLQVLKI